MELLKKYYLNIFISIISSIMFKAQINCNSYNNSDCKKACELVNLAEQYQGYRDSQIAFDKAIELCPNFDYAYREKSVPYLKRGDFITWKKLIDKAVELNPKANLGYRGWCQYQFLRNYKAAINDIEEFEKIIGTDNIGCSQNGNYNLIIVKALCYKGIGEKKKAIEIIERQLSSKNYQTMLFDFYHLGVLYYEEGKYSKAKEFLNRQIENGDYYAEPYYYLGLINLKENNMDLAKKNTEKSLLYYSRSKFMKDKYAHIMDKIYKEDLNLLKKNLEN
ncbi:tetratricopeptide repeat protein [Elizabethkingia anophelis]|uniref:tetratricopeptide repeat protein n=2 Tax=Elizabethkingia anophelis TaxID=1117645 RepID=UPI00301A995F